MNKIEPGPLFTRPPLFRAASINSFDRPYLIDEALGGGLVQHGRGVYSLPSAKITNTEALFFRAPHAIAALETALWLHQLIGTEPSPIWIAISQDDRRPRVSPLRIETLRWSQPPADADVVTCQRTEEGPSVRCFSAVKTVVDLLRARNRVGARRALSLVDDLLDGGLDETQLLECADRNRATYPVRRYLARRHKRR
ncbi:MAG: hypothetical protein QM723_39260 [Myxococcaceae bacterium]